VPVNAQGFRILQPGVSVPLAATLLANAITWRQGGDVAVITPALQGGFAQSVVARVALGPCGQQQNGPYSIHWEGTDREETQLIVGALQLPAAPTAAEACAALRALPPSGPGRAAISWANNQIHAVGRTAFTREEIEAVIARNVALRRQHGGGGSHLFNAMTVQQAKNRKFEGVVIIWPYQVGGDIEHKRRLLYNAVTRARRWARIFSRRRHLRRRETSARNARLFKSEVQSLQKRFHLRDELMFRKAPTSDRPNLFRLSPVASIPIHAT
jgi:hypothetical protein